jgi:hypothetical protein
MKTRIVSFGIFYLATLLASAQSSGVYLGANDFASGKLSYEINCSTEKHKIKLNEFLNKDFITVVHDKKPHNLNKKDIFGYKDFNGMTYRFVGNSHYVILNPAEKILLYKHTIVASKNQKDAIHYFFSLPGNDKIQSLTLTNLKKAFRVGR